MPTNITINGLSITGTDNIYNGGFIYDRLIGWQSLPDVDLMFARRPNAPGAFEPGQTFPQEAVISVEGQFFGRSRAEAIQAREDLTALYNNGRPVTMTVVDDLRTTSRQVYVKAVDFPWTIHPEFNYTLDVSAPDPRRYGNSSIATTQLAQPGTGLDWTQATGLAWTDATGLDWGTTATDGRVSVTNVGNTDTVSRYTVGGGEILAGFALVNVATGERLTYIGPVTAGTTVILDTSARTAFINGTAPAGRFLPNPQWWIVPAKATLSIQFIALGPTTGTPTLTIETRPAYY